MKKTEQDCREELAYIKGVDFMRPGRNFNYDPVCFRDYCRMQAEIFERAGFPMLALDVRNWILTESRI